MSNESGCAPQKVSQRGECDVMLIIIADFASRLVSSHILTVTSDIVLGYIIVW